LTPRISVLCQVSLTWKTFKARVINGFRFLTFTVATFGHAFLTSANTTTWFFSGFIDKTVEKLYGIVRWELTRNSWFFCNFISNVAAMPGGWLEDVEFRLFGPSASPD